MPSRPTSSLLPLNGAALLRFGGAYVALSVLVLGPALVTPLPLSPYAPLVPEVLVLATAVAYAGGTRWGALARTGAGLGMGVLVLYQVYDAAVYMAFRRSGILYEDLQFADNLLYFAFDLRSWWVVGGTVAGLLAVGAAAWGGRWALRTLARAGSHTECRALLLPLHVVTWTLVVVVGPAQAWGSENLTYQTSNERTRVRTVTTRALANAGASLRLDTMLDSLGTAPVQAHYAAYDTLALDRRPSISFLTVESYGSALTRHPDLRPPFRDLVRRTADTLAASGWHMATARSVSPVRGGRSWLAIASLLTGVELRHQLLFNKVQSDLDTAPHLVNTLDAHGYHTVALQPFTFARPGLPVRNLYGFDATLYRDDLQYRGPPYGLADAPDQYSLQFAHETQLAGNKPYFLFFEAVDSHALWNYGLPPLPADWRQFNQAEGTEAGQRRTLRAQAPPRTPFLPDSLTRPRIYDQSRPARFLRHIGYEWEVLREYLLDTAPRGSLVILLGDHQPPLLDTQDATVPVHILSTDATWVERARRHGFTEGLWPTDGTPTLRHEGIYSLLMQILTEPRPGGAAPPVYRPEGAAPSLLVTPSAPTAADP
jgi:hypothetical protein